ncbi:efflux RND transporter periplasmic adaptor subunit [Alcaligenaceae bacterium]|nr:efflux RND transporter periplasmic adaptor subunit [Alcaligenaceae bacterium]
MKTSTPGLFLVLAIGIAVGVGSTYWLVRQESALPTPAIAAASRAPANNAAVVVETAPVVEIALPRGVSAVGTLRSEDSVMLRPEITGRIAEINFDEGGRVKKGQVLVKLDDSVVRAQLQQAEANLSLASSQHRRAQELTKQGFISKQARDEAASQLKVQQAAVALARAQLEKTAILAPFDGMVGLRNVSVGDYVSPGIDLVPLESIDPLKVDFRIPEQFLGLVHVGIGLTLSFDALPSQQREGKVDAISPLIDVGGRSILLRATVPNTDDALRPGMFARVRLQFTDDKGLVVPETALVPSGEAQYVYRVKDDRAERVVVQVGLRRGGQVEIVSGLQAGDVVMTSGLQKVTDGAAVRVLPSDQAAGNT